MPVYAEPWWGHLRLGASKFGGLAGKGTRQACCLLRAGDSNWRQFVGAAGDQGRQGSGAAVLCHMLAAAVRLLNTLRKGQLTRCALRSTFTALLLTQCS